MRKEYMIPETEVTPLFSTSVLCGSNNMPVSESITDDQW